MIIIRNKLTGYLLPGRFPALCIWPLILIRPDMRNDYQETLNHEIIHSRQQIEMGWIFFFIWYFLEYLIKLLIYRNFLKAYLSLSHEREAYLNEHNTDYMVKRKPYAWTQFISG